MKKIECITIPLKLAEIKQALKQEWIEDIKVNRGFGRNLYGNIELESFFPKLKIEIFVADENVDKVVKAIQQAVTPTRAV